MIYALICRSVLHLIRSRHTKSTLEDGYTIHSWITKFHHVSCLYHRILTGGAVIPLIFPKVPQSSQTESFGFPSYPIPYRNPWASDWFPKWRSLQFWKSHGKKGSKRGHDLKKLVTHDVYMFMLYLTRQGHQTELSSQPSSLKEKHTRSL